MTFKRLSGYLQQLEQNTSRLKITEILADLFKECKEEEIDKVCYLSLGRLLPQYQGIEFQMAQKMMEKAIGKAFGVEAERVRRKMRERGDLGEVGEEIKNQKSSRFAAKIKTQELFEEAKDKGDMGKMGVLRVYERLMEIAKESGEGSVERKVEKMAALLQDLDPLSVRFVIRMPLGKMRLGFSDMTVLDALSWMLVGDKSLRAKLEDAYNVLADVGEIARRVRSVGGIRGVGKIEPKLGTPILPALCQRLGMAEEIVEKLGEMAVEPKYDGTRLQVHLSHLSNLGASGVRIFTRNLENVTHMFPDIVKALPREISAKEVILDGEGVGIDPKTGKFLPFQETIKRKRKHQIEEKVKEVPFNYFVFDILYKDGESLIGMPFEQRRKILEKVIRPGGLIKISPQIITKDAKKLRKYHDEQIEKGLEGVVAKKWHSPYEPGRRGFKWVKLKQEVTKKGGGLADTIDCVVMGTYRGKGKRAGFGVGAFLVGIRGRENILTVSKIGTGLSDEQWKELRMRSERWELKEKPKEYEVDKNLFPDIWCRPEIVVEIQADNITQSPVHTAGLALRFPRLVRFREDKEVGQITSIKELENLYKIQFREV